MIGTNTIRFNRATMNEAVKFYLEQSVLRFPSEVDVTKVEQDGDAFIVTVSQPFKKEESKPQQKKGTK